MSSLTRTMVLSAGRASTRAWLRAAAVDSPALRQAADSAYRRDSERVPWPGPRTLRMHLAFSVLPGVAMYRALQSQGTGSEEAARLVEDALVAMRRPERRLFARLVSSDRGRRVFMRAVEVASPRLYPGPGWQATWRERSPDRVAFDFSRCYFLDMLRRLDATTLAPAYCAPDDALYADLHPRLGWTRSGTLATGAPVCDFCFELRGSEAGAKRGGAAGPTPLRIDRSQPAARTRGTAPEATTVA